MSASAVPYELISLAQHVGLSERRWIDRVVNQLVMAALLGSDSPPTAEQLVTLVQTRFIPNLHVKAARKRIAHLENIGVITRIPPGHYKLSESVLAEASAHREQAEREEQALRTLFIEQVEAVAPNVDAEKVWTLFRERFIQGFIQTFGVEVFRHIDESRTLIDQSPGPYLQDFLSELPQAARADVKQIVLDFLDPGNEPGRRLILRELSLHLMLEACRLPRDVLEKINRSIGTTPVFNVLLDTNVLPYVLDLDEDQALTEAVRGLLALKKQLEGLVQLNFYVHRSTLAEARGAIERATKTLQAQWAGGGPSASSSGIVRRYLADGRRPAAAHTHFRPYVENLLGSLKPYGIELFNEPIEDLQRDPAVLLDIARNILRCQVAIRSGEDRALARKALKTIDHDIRLWHMVRRKRPSWVESPAEARYWLVTIENWFLAVDAQEVLDSENDVPVCVHPIALLRMLHLWLPRTSAFEVALIGSMRHTLLSEFDQEAEDASVRIIEILQWLSDSGLPQDSWSNVLLNDALRHRVAESQSVQEQIKTVLEEVREQDEQLPQDLLSEESISRIEEHLTSDAETAAFRVPSDAVTELIADLSLRIRNLETQTTEAIHLRERITFYAGAAPAVAVGVATAVATVALALAALTPLKGGGLVLSASLMWLWATLTLCARMAHGRPAVREHRLWRVVLRARVKLLTLIGSAIGSIVGTAVFEWL
jgi:hypothetical protein